MNNAASIAKAMPIAWNRGRAETILNGVLRFGEVRVGGGSRPTLYAFSNRCASPLLIARPHEVTSALNVALYLLMNHKQEAKRTFSGFSVGGQWAILVQRYTVIKSRPMIESDSTIYASYCASFFCVLRIVGGCLVLPQGRATRDV